ncbi:hypothetical protein F4777DRAFT_600892 [Nemania sp. FL0916]|nr:hypothetical protein F4777DRAFT_600892 [Nemania sp. FL0916]
MSIKIEELENAVCDVIQIIKQIPELTGARLAVIGDLTMCKYVPGYELTRKIRFITNAPSINDLTEKLLCHPTSPFIRHKQSLFYRSPVGQDIKIIFSPACAFPYLPDSALLIPEIPYGVVPYVTAADLASFKVYASLSPATSPTERRQESDDALALASPEAQARITADGAGAAAPVTHKARRRTVSALPPDFLTPQQEQLIRDALRAGEDPVIHLALPSPPPDM